jgi:hypothetical protein
MTPGGGYVLDAVEAADLAAAVDEVAASPLVRGTSSYALAMLATRTGRVAPEGPASISEPVNVTYQG